MSEEEEVVEFGVTVIESFKRVGLDTIKARSPKRYIEAARGANFMRVEAATTRTLEKKPPIKSGERAGEARPDKEVAHLWLMAGTPNAFGFIAHFADNSFESAQVRDIIGWPLELWSDYTPTANLLLRHKDETEKGHTQRVKDAHRTATQQDYKYNDGEQWITKGARTVATAAAFEEWLADFVPGFEPRKAPVRKTATEKMEAATTALIENGEWNG